MEQLKQIILSNEKNNEYHLNHSPKEILDDLQELYSIDKTVSLKHIKKYVCNHNLYDLYNIESPSHPLHILKLETQFFKDIINNLVPLFNHPLEIGPINSQLNQLSGLFKHFNRKEKLYMPILERHNVNTFGRVVWRNDDAVRFSYSALRKKLKRTKELSHDNIYQSFLDFKNKLEYSLDELMYLFVPVSYVTLSEDEFSRIDNESPGFGYAIDIEEKDIVKNNTVLNHTEQIQFGSGFLTLKEADIILNNLPLEITFIDPNGIFKYFNDMCKASDMMFTRTQISIGRPVSNCHPPQAMSRVMQLIRDLKAQRKSHESMWFKMGEKFVYVTYKAVFDEHNVYMGILETVQDIQKFHELPLNMKRFIKRNDQQFN